MDLTYLGRLGKEGKMTSLEELKKYVQKLSEGKIEGDDEAEVLRLLADCWEDLDGSGDTAMSTYKLYRYENLTFIPPSTIQFEIERHGGTVQGSVYANVHLWTINLEEGTADGGTYSRRLVGVRDKPLKVKPIANEICQEIMDQNKESKYLIWKSDKKVRVRIGDIIPETIKQTTIARRKRFRAALEELLTANGWQTTGAYNVYEKTE